MSIDSDITGIVHGIPGFASLDEAAIRAVAAASSLKSIAEGNYFYHEDELSSDVFFVVSGIVGIHARHPASTPPTRDADEELLILRSGAFFGVLSFLDGARRDMYALARERTLVLRMDGQLLKAACEASPEVGRAVYAMFGKVAARIARDIAMELRNEIAGKG